MDKKDKKDKGDVVVIVTTTDANGKTTSKGLRGKKAEKVLEAAEKFPDSIIWVD